MPKDADLRQREIEWERSQLPQTPVDKEHHAHRRRVLDFPADFTRAALRPLLMEIENRQSAVLNGRSGNFTRENVFLVWFRSEELACITLQVAVNEFEALQRRSGTASDQEDEQRIGLKILAQRIGDTCLRQLVRNRTDQMIEKRKLEKNDLLLLLRGSRLAATRRTAVGVAKRHIQSLDGFLNDLAKGAPRSACRFWIRHVNDFERLGALLISCGAKTDIFEVQKAKLQKRIRGAMRFAEGERTSAILVAPTDRFLALLSRHAKNLARRIHPSLPPMICKPIAWKNLGGPGPYVDSTIAMELVRPGHIDRWRLHNALHRQEKRQKLVTVFEAVNAVQDTAWEIDQWILAQMTRLWRTNRKMFPGLPNLPIEPVKPRQAYSRQSLKSALLKSRREWAEYFRQCRMRNAARLYRGRVMQSRFALARELVVRRPFYFPHHLDFRGRLYPIPRTFHPQDDDIGRSLIRFAAGAPLGRSGVRWLKIHLANMWGLDKHSFLKRTEWVDSHQAQIRVVVADPLSTVTWWSEADKPWGFLAACHEWVSYLDWERTRKPPQFRSHLPVCLDGTCNGIQHLSALARDSNCAREVNLLPSIDRRPRDIYLRAADLMLLRLGGQHVTEHLKVDATMSRALVRWFSDRRIARNVAKAAIMNYPYGISQRSIARKLLTERGWLPARVVGNRRWKLASAIANLLRNKIAPAILGNVHIVMSWLRDQIATPLARQNRGVYWVTPSGFPVIHEYRIPAQKRVRTPLGRIAWPRDNVRGRRLLPTRQRSALAPNIIHSLDAAHLALAVHRLREAGVQSISVVHDSYAVHARNIELLRRVLRETFVRVHSRDLLRELWNDARQKTGLPLKSPPTPAAPLDMSLVLESEYMFS